MNMKKILILALSLLWMPTLRAQRWLGGDISLLPSYEDAGTKYYDRKGTEWSALNIFKDVGWRAMRVRLFVDPSNASDEHKGEGVCQDLPYVIRLSKQIKEAGLQLMLDLHYSDTWADPSKQFVPKRWERESTGVRARKYPKALADSVYAYTTHVLKTLKAEGIVPDMIQTGNEITYGMLWPAGKVMPDDDANWDVFSSLLKAGVKACREQCPEAQVIIHTEHAQDWNATRGYYERIGRYGVDYDVIGLSYYPMWHGTVRHLGVVIDSLHQVFSKPVMIVETAAYYSHENDPWESGKNHDGEAYPATVEGQRQFVEDLVAELSGHKCVTGLFWWFPEENGSGKQVTHNWLNRGLFDNRTGKALPALSALRPFTVTGSGRGRRPFRPRPVIDEPAEQWSPTTLIVMYDESVGKKYLKEAFEKSGAEIIYEYRIIHGFAIRKPDSMTLDEAIEYYKKVKGCIAVNKDRRVQLMEQH